MPDVPMLDHKGRAVGWLSMCGDYEPGDPPPTGYNDWHDWAKVQLKAGLRSVRCDQCGRYKFPQEIARTETREEVSYLTKRDAIAERNPQPRIVNVPICTVCELKARDAAHLASGK